MTIKENIHWDDWDVLRWETFSQVTKLNVANYTQNIFFAFLVVQKEQPIANY